MALFNEQVGATLLLPPLLPQYMLVIAGLQVPWPSTLSVPFAALAALWSGISSDSLALECFLPQHQRYHVSGSAVDQDIPAGDMGRADAGSRSMPLGVLQALVFVCASGVLCADCAAGVAGQERCAAAARLLARARACTMAGVAAQQASDSCA
jgi:hypothetical protein